MEINRTKRLNNLQFYPKANQKTMIFWHHTAGTNADGAISWWNQTPDAVGTAYVIERDGTIFECFDPKLWAYHAGVKADDDYIEKNAIGIELVAAGQLHLEKDGKFYFYPLFPNKVAKTVIPKEEVWDLGEKGHMGFRYYHAYTEKQIKSLIDLSNQLVVDFKIPLPSDWASMGFFKYNEDVTKKHLPGIWSHTSVRKDKTDIVPEPNFLKKVYEGIKVPLSSTPIETEKNPKSNKK